jgi:hypothetical protein
VELQQIVERYAEAIAHVDGANQNAPGVNARTGTVYQDGFKALGEPVAVEAIDDAWEVLHPNERQAHSTREPYSELPAAKCDHVFTTDGVLDSAEWGIEVKRLQFVGDNGKRNDFAVGKVLSPYLKDRGLIHDALRLRDHGFTRRVAVIAYSFDYDRASLGEAERTHPSKAALDVIKEIRRVVVANGGHLRTRPLIEFADAILVLRGLTTGPRAQVEFEAWRHPAGGRGTLFGWEVRRPQFEPDYDPRHPW